MSQISKYQTSQYFECECSDFDHTFRASYFNHMDKNLGDDYLALEIHLRAKPFFKRLWLGVKYIFGFRSIYGDFDEILLYEEDVKKLKDMMEDYLNHISDIKKSIKDAP